MNWSLQIATVRGIAIQVHVTFPLIVAWAMFNWGVALGGGLNGAVFGAVLIILLFTCVVLHELGHALAAQAYGIPVRDITLLPIGGVARLTRIPERASQEFWIAIAGPAVNVGLLVVLGAALALGFGRGGEIMPEALYRLMHEQSLATLIVYLFTANVWLVLFNMLPAFPLDGGRVLRALLASQLSYTRATEIAVALGQALAVAIGIWGLLTGNVLAMVVAVFIFVGAGQEGQEAAVRRSLQGLRARDIVNFPTLTLHADDTLGRAVDLALHSYQTEFPVMEDSRLVGLLTSGDLIGGLRDRGAGALIRDVMHAEFLRLSANDSLITVRQRMAEGGMTVVAIFDGDRFLGLTTPQDIANGLVLLAADDRRLLRLRREAERGT